MRLASPTAEPPATRDDFGVIPAAITPISSHDHGLPGRPSTRTAHDLGASPGLALHPRRRRPCPRAPCSAPAGATARRAARATAGSCSAPARRRPVRARLALHPRGRRRDERRGPGGSCSAPMGRRGRAGGDVRVGLLCTRGATGPRGGDGGGGLALHPWGRRSEERGGGREGRGSCSAPVGATGPRGGDVRIGLLCTRGDSGPRAWAGAAGAAGQVWASLVRAPIAMSDRVVYQNGGSDLRRKAP